MSYPIAATPFSGSNPNPAYTTSFIPEIWSTKLIERFYDATVLAAISNTEYEGEIKNHGDKIIMRQRPIITVRNYEANQELVVDRPSSPVLEMVIDQGRYFNLHLDDVMEVQSDIDLMNQWSADASEQMKIVIDTDCLVHMVNQATARNRGSNAGRLSQNITLGVAGTPVTLSRTNVVDYLILMGQVLDEQNIPENGRWVVIPAWAASLLKRSDLRDASLTGDGTSVARNGRLGMIDRFTLYSSNLLPTSTTDGVAGNDTDAATYIYAGHKNALSFASQMTKMEVMRSERTFGNLMRGLQVYGRRVIDSTAYCQLYARPDAAAGAPT
jgi:hypothetical protein